MLSEPGGEEAERESEPVTRDKDVEQLLAWSLRLAYIPVVVLLLAGLGAFVYGTALFVHAIDQICHHAFPVRHQIGLFLADIDLFLIGATLLITAIGFYELFIRRDPPERVDAHSRLARHARSQRPQGESDRDDRDGGLGDLRRGGRRLAQRTSRSSISAVGSLPWWWH